MKFHNNKLKNRIFDKILLNVHFSITIAYKDFKFCLLSPHTHSEGTVSHIFDLGASFILCKKTGNIFYNFEASFSKVHKI